MPPSVTASKSSTAQTAPLEGKRLESPLLYTIADVQQLLQLGRNTVYELCNTAAPDGIRCISVGKSKRVPRAELERWIERQVSSSDGL